MKQKEMLEYLQGDYLREQFAERGMLVRSAKYGHAEGDEVIETFLVTGTHRFYFNPETHKLRIEDNEIVVELREGVRFMEVSETIEVEAAEEWPDEIDIK